jgi:hypothetical protein
VGLLSIEGGDFYFLSYCVLSIVVSLNNHALVNGSHMLPDLPKLKRDIQHVLDRYLKLQTHSRLGVFQEAQKQIIHEGNRTRVIRADGSTEESLLRKASAEMEIKYDEVPRLTFESRLVKLNDIAEQMAMEMSKQLFGSLTDTLNKSGQSINNQGRPLDAEAIFSVLEKIQLEFDSSGQHKKLSIVLPPALIQKFHEVLKTIDNDPELSKRHEEIMQRKKQEWHDREASRKLVG